MDEPDKAFVRCSFCGISQTQARRMITGPGVYICERCVGLCNGILETELPDGGVDEQGPPAGVAVLRAPGEAGRTLDCPFPEDLDRMLQTLDAREREVLWLRFGLDRGEPRTLIEVADRFNLPPERIKQIETGAISKIRPIEA